MEPDGRPPSQLEAADIWRGIWYEEAHHSTAIEGNTLVLKQVETLLAEGRAVGNKQLKEYMEVKGYADAAEWVYGQGAASDSDALLTLTEVRLVHTAALQATKGPHGQWRSCRNWVEDYLANKYKRR